MAQEHRQHKRYWVKGLKGRLRERYFLGLLSRPTLSEYPCMDISEGGLQFVSKKSFKPKENILLDISAPLTRETPIRAKARVAWSRLSQEFGLYLIGARFISIPRARRSEFRIMIERGGEDEERVGKHIRIKIIKELL
ncbi:MAG: PilZ domain-containing protein [Planctomycetes bacterium]|nr:PilZ domain-containing protein [Planctomycetota bacterium]